MTETCKNRVWDNGDMDDCNEKVFAYGYCQTCLVVIRVQLREKIAMLRMEESLFLQQLHELGEDFPP
jgi:hypothetical protein